MKTIGMAAAAFLVACGASAAHGAFERGGNTKDSSADEIAKYEAVAGLPRDPNEKTVEPPKGMVLEAKDPQGALRRMELVAGPAGVAWECESIAEPRSLTTG